MSQQMKTVSPESLWCASRSACLKMAWRKMPRSRSSTLEALTITSDEGKAVNEKTEKRIQAIGTEMDKLRKDIEDKEERLRTQDRVDERHAQGAAAKRNRRATRSNSSGRIRTIKKK